jgi:hypothetical protein
MNQIGKAPALPIISGTGFVRSDSGRPRDSNELFTSFDQELRDDGEHGQGAGEGPDSKGYGAEKPIAGAAEVATAKVVRPPPDDPVLAMARKLAGDGKSDEALGRLLGDLDDMKSAPPENDGPPEPTPPVAPFAHSNSIDDRFHHAASVYEWGAQALNSEDPLRPGVIYSERF